jgi:hypothetical protein
MSAKHIIARALLRRQMRSKIKRYEESAEAAYSAMYDARGPAAKDCYEDARMDLSRAIETANEAKLADDAVRLSARLKEITEIYNRQFRWVGYS